MTNNFVESLVEKMHYKYPVREINFTPIVVDIVVAVSDEFVKKYKEEFNSITHRRTQYIADLFKDQCFDVIKDTARDIKNGSNVNLEVIQDCNNLISQVEGEK